jgi:hypothetical protein
VDRAAVHEFPAGACPSISRAKENVVTRSAKETVRDGRIHAVRECLDSRYAARILFPDLAAGV